MMVLVDLLLAETRLRYVSAATCPALGILEFFPMVSWPIRIMRYAVAVSCSIQVQFGLMHQSPDKT